MTREGWDVWQEKGEIDSKRILGCMTREVGRVIILTILYICTNNTLYKAEMALLPCTAF